MKSLKFYLKDAMKNGYALGAYNFVNMETLKGICEGCKKTNSPAIVSVSEGALKYMNESFVKNLYDSAKNEYKVPIFLHLDHGKSFEVCKKAIALGFESVMIDGSSLDYAENVKLTKKVTDYAHKKGVLVEAELGVLAGVEDTVSAEKNIYTDPDQAKDFVEKTNCDTLAIAIGTSHGAYKFKGEQKLAFDILKKIQEKIPNTPLVLHGASSVPQKYVETFNQYGGNITGAVGVPEKLLTKACTKFHVYKINSDTDIRLAYMSTFRKYLTENPSVFDLRKPNACAIEEISNLIADKNKRVFKNANKA